YTDYIQFLVDQHDPITALQVSEMMRARTLEEALGEKQAKQVPISAVKGFLRTRKKIVLTYWLASDKSYLWVITGFQLKHFTLPAKHQIEGKVDNYQQKITALEDFERIGADGRDLYRILVEPARELIPANAQVVIIPDGGLGKLNFETLIVPDPSPHFWIDDVQIEEASSIALLIKSPSTVLPFRKLLDIGDPLEVTADYPGLKYAPKEIAAAAEPFASSEKKVVSGADAPPSSYAASGPGQFDVIHFAPHGFASLPSP